MTQLWSAHFFSHCYGCKDGNYCKSITIPGPSPSPTEGSQNKHAEIQNFIKGLLNSDYPKPNPFSKTPNPLRLFSIWECSPYPLF